MFNRLFFALLALCGIAMLPTLNAQAPAPAPAQPAAQEAPKPNDYRDPRNWLCRPGRTDDACAFDMTTTVVSADGKLTRETWTADPKAPIDCFYVYPTVSTDQTPNSDMTADPAEVNVVRQQFARMASKCRPFAPLYRQVTISALMRGLAGGGRPTLDRGLAYDDVRDAWNDYLKHDNQGRGVVLVGHSQGSYVLMPLIRNEIEGKPIQSQLVSAILMGATVPVAKGKDTGGAFRNIPLCRSASQIGCVIAFTSFRSTIKPPANTLFGKADDPAHEAGCTNPANLAGGSGQLHAYLSAGGRTITGTAPPQPWVTPPQEINTPWVSVPGLLTAACATNEHATYLEITVHGNPNDPRVDDIVGDLGRPGAPMANWGLHLVDANIAMGNLLEIIGQQTKSYLARKK